MGVWIFGNYGWRCGWWREMGKSYWNRIVVKVVLWFYFFMGFERKYWKFVIYELGNRSLL